MSHTGDDSAMTVSTPDAAGWPDLPWHAWEPTLSTAHRWLQIVGRVRMVLTPKQPHWAHVPLTVTERGFSTGPIPHVGGAFDIDLDVVDHRLAIVRGGRPAFELQLEPMSVARFYATVLEALAAQGIDVVIPTTPAEGIGGKPFDSDDEHDAYVAEHATMIWRGFVVAGDALAAFGEANPGDGWTAPRLFWGSLDLAISRFATDAAFEQSAGWWPTSERLGPAFYAYTKPEPAGYRVAPLEPAAAAFDQDFGEFILTWDAARSISDPDAAARAFLASSARAGAGAGAQRR
jgi:hypothetical protein